MEATKHQKQIIHIVVPKPIKEEMVQWATDDNDKISTSDLTFDQANEILKKFGKEPHKLAFWATFDKNNAQHRYILSLCVQYGWWEKKLKYGRVANLDKLNEWLHDKSPVKKALKNMAPDELTTVINALSSMMLKQNSKSK